MQVIAKSVFNSKINWTVVGTILLSILEMNDWTNIVPDQYHKYIALAAGIIIILLRSGGSTPPLAFIPPNQTKMVSVTPPKSKE